MDEVFQVYGRYWSDHVPRKGGKNEEDHRRTVHDPNSGVERDGQQLDTDGTRYADTSVWIQDTFNFAG